ncbi:MAG: class I SAM-dependent methyltransferase [Candidatus Omnitrophica bacterium]|nr:class I SAM-dependent methyltransferase [Candidatus Omnitrophota bacterium]
MIRFTELIKDRLKKYELYNKKEYWDKRTLQRKGLARSMWSSNNYNSCLDALEKKIIYNYPAPLDGLIVLDLGCGIGRISTYLASCGAHVTGLDISPATIKAAEREILPNVKGKIQYISGDLFTKELQKESFDIVLGIAMLTIIFSNKERFEKGIERICQLTKPGGKILLIEPIHSIWFLKRICGFKLQRWILEFEKNGAMLSNRTGLAFYPFRIFLAFLNLPLVITKPLFLIGEFILKLPFMDWFSDYKVLLFRKKNN